MNKKEIQQWLNDNFLVFEESDSRMSYGFIGKLIKKYDNPSMEDVYIASIFNDCFYSHSKMFSLNSTSLKMIASIQKEFRELTRDSKGKITTVTLK